MSGEPTASPAQATRRRPGCLRNVLIAAVASIALVVAIGYAFDEGDNADQPRHGFDAGPASAYETPSVTPFDAEHLFLVRLPDGSFIALYDRSTKQQELQGGTCRVLYEETAGLGTLDPIPGLRGGFVEECEDSRAVWRADGAFAFGTGYGDLDRYGVRVDAGAVIVDTETRTCTRSKGVVGQEPYEQRTCGRGE